MTSAETGEQWAKEWNEARPDVAWLVITRHEGWPGENTDRFHMPVAIVDRIIADHQAASQLLAALREIAQKHGPADSHQYCLEQGTHDIACIAIAAYEAASVTMAANAEAAR